MRIRWGLIAVTLTMALAACGGSHHRPTGGRPRAAPAEYAPTAMASLVLPASARGPTTCTVYGSGFGTQVIFDSQSLNVSPECQAWTAREPGAGYLWAYQPTGAAIDATAVPICDLRDPSGRVAVTVIEDTGFAPASAPERERVTRACSSLAAAGWVKSPPRG